MPSKSGKQHRLMALVANNPKAAKRIGIPQSVGEEFMKADKGKKFAKGGCATKAEAKSIAKKEVSGHEKAMHGMKKGGKVKKYAEGGAVASGKKPTESDYDKKLREDALQQMRDKKMMEQSGKAYEKAREQSLGAPDKKRAGGMCKAKKYARGGGIEVRGKTRGRII